MFLEKLRTMLQLRSPERAGQAELRPAIDEISVAWPFAEAAVDVSPTAPGVYLLYKKGQLIYIGVAVNGSGIRHELAGHLGGVRGACTRDATAFIYETAADPLCVHRRYLDSYRERCGGRLPSGNEAEVNVR